MLKSSREGTGSREPLVHIHRVSMATTHTHTHTMPAPVTKTHDPLNDCTPAWKTYPPTSHTQQVKIKSSVELLFFICLNGNQKQITVYLFLFHSAISSPVGTFKFHQLFTIQWFRKLSSFLILSYNVFLTCAKRRAGARAGGTVVLETGDFRQTVERDTAQLAVSE